MCKCIKICLFVCCLCTFTLKTLSFLFCLYHFPHMNKYLYIFIYTLSIITFLSCPLLSFPYVKSQSNIPTVRYNSIEIGRCLYGLQSMSPAFNPDLPLLFSKLAGVVHDMSGVLYGRDAALALYGLKTQTDTGPEVGG